MVETQGIHVYTTSDETFDQHLTYSEHVVVIGHGDCGAGIAQRFRGMGARVTAVETEPLARLEARLEGFNTSTLEACLTTAEIVVSATGSDDVFRREHFASLPSNALVANAGPDRPPRVGSVAGCRYPDTS